TAHIRELMLIDTRDCARDDRISRPHLMKVVNWLAQLAISPPCEGAPGVWYWRGRPKITPRRGGAGDGACLCDCRMLFDEQSMRVFRLLSAATRFRPGADSVSHCVGSTHACERGVQAQRLP